MLTKAAARERARLLLLKLAEDAASLGHVPAEKHSEATKFFNSIIDQAFPEPQLTLNDSSRAELVKELKACANTGAPLKAETARAAVYVLESGAR